MSLKCAILGIIDMSPSSGYDIKRIFDYSVKYYWTATHSQIYRTLDELREQGLATYEKVIQDGLPNKNIYSITEKGKAELQKWALESSELPAVRNKLLVQLAFSEYSKTAEIIKLLKNHASNLTERIAEYNGAMRMQTISGYARSEREKTIWLAILKNGIAVYEAELIWANETIATLQDY